MQCVTSSYVMNLFCVFWNKVHLSAKVQLNYTLLKDLSAQDSPAAFWYIFTKFQTLVQKRRKFHWIITNEILINFKPNESKTNAILRQKLRVFSIKRSVFNQIAEIDVLPSGIKSRLFWETRQSFWPFLYIWVWYL